MALRQYLDLWSRLQSVHLNEQLRDKSICKWTANQQYSASSAYRAFSIGKCGVPGAKELSKIKAPPKCKFFMWSVLLGRVWTAARRVCHGLQDDDSCALCSQASETSAHLLAACVYAREFWFLILRRLSLRAIAPTAEVVDVVDWWLPSRKRLPKDSRKRFNTLFLLATWLLWLERSLWQLLASPTTARLARQLPGGGVGLVGCGFRRPR
jgi:hypothetical protein